MSNEHTVLPMIMVLQAQTPKRFQGITWDRDTTFPQMLISTAGPLGGQHITWSQIRSAFILALFPLSSAGARETTASLVPPHCAWTLLLVERPPFIALATHPAVTVPHTQDSRSYKGHGYTSP